MMVELLMMQVEEMSVKPVMLPLMPAMSVVMAKINQTLLSLVRPTFTNHTEIQNQIATTRQ
jgi:hypothetical protein